MLRVALSAWGEEAAPRAMASSPHATGGAPASPARDAEAAAKAEHKAQKKAHKEAKRIKKERKELKKLRSRSADSAGAFGGGFTSGDEALPAQAPGTAGASASAPKPVKIPAPAAAPARAQVAASPKVLPITSTTTIPGGNGKPTELVIEVKTGERSLVWLLVLRSLIGFIMIVLVFVFLSIVVRTSQRTTVTSEGWLMAYSDPWGANTVPQSQEPLKTVQLESTVGSLLDVHTAPLESIHKLHTLRFAVMQDNDWVAYVEIVERIVRPMSGTTTTVSFASGDSLVIDSDAQPPLQVVFYSGNVAYQVMVPDRFAGSGAAGACVECPDNMHAEGPSCACDEGFQFARDSFHCVPARRRALQAAEAGGAVTGAAVATSTPPNTQISTGACIANITYNNVLVGSTLKTLVFNSPLNAWGSALNIATGLQSNKYSGTPLPKCAKSWTYTDDQGTTQKNVTMSGCASLVNFLPKGATTMQTNIKLATDSNTAFKDIFWCPREDMPDYHKMFFGTGTVKDIDMLWGFCTPCPTPAPTTGAPSAKPTAPTTGKPSAKPTAPTTGKPTSKPTTQAPTTSKPSAKPTRQPTALPSKAPTRAPSLKPTTGKPSLKPTTGKPTAPTTLAPSTKPTAAPTTLAPSVKPTTAGPTGKPSTLKPTASRSPSNAPTTRKPSAAPSEPTPAPTRNPTNPGETFQPSATPTGEPTTEPSEQPTEFTTDPPSSETEAPSSSTCISSQCQNADIAFEASKNFCETVADRRLCSVSELRNIRDRFLSLYNSQDTTMKEAAFAEGSFFQCFHGNGSDAASDVMRTMLWADGGDCLDGSRYSFAVEDGTAECVDATDSSLRTVCCPTDPSPETQAMAEKRAKTEITSQVSVTGAAATVAAKKNTRQALRAP